ncbi:hypothetical protein EYF80_041733 [Liparis tanakae]|uniref:Uncharacterized protein n=1 Tax=Liparis tanakae TaxID=230148 RepID=A0A4Z2G3B5_9TELE|nr:hypothetical protein EYF80_041733 [Liparis tanakae]
MSGQTSSSNIGAPRDSFSIKELNFCCFSHYWARHESCEDTFVSPGSLTRLRRSSVSRVLREGGDEIEDCFLLCLRGSLDSSVLHPPTPLGPSVHLSAEQGEEEEPTASIKGSAALAAEQTRRCRLQGLAWRPRSSKARGNVHFTERLEPVYQEESMQQETDLQSGAGAALEVTLLDVRGPSEALGGPLESLGLQKTTSWLRMPGRMNPKVLILPPSHHAPLPPDIHPLHLQLRLN